jgi:hypothetical protein
MRYFETTCSHELNEEEVKPHFINYLTQFMNHYNNVKVKEDYKKRNNVLYEKAVQYIHEKMQELNLLVIHNLSIAELSNIVLEIIHHLIPYNKKLYIWKEYFVSNISLVKGQYVIPPSNA